MLQQGAVVRRRAVEANLIADILFGFCALGLGFAGNDEDRCEEGDVLYATAA